METFSEVILPDNYIRHSPVTGELFVNQTHRAMTLDVHFINSLHLYIREKYKSDPSRILYNLGYHWGNSAYQNIEDLALEIFKDVKSIRELAMPRFHRLFTNHLAALGWGNFELKRRDDFLFVDLYNSLVVDALASTDKHSACDLYAGFFAGIFSRISNMSLACIEITCKSDGYENCSFLLDSQETIAEVYEYVKQKLTPLEAFDKLKREVG